MRRAGVWFFGRPGQVMFWIAVVAVQDDVSQRHAQPRGAAPEGSDEADGTDLVPAHWMHPEGSTKDPNCRRRVMRLLS